MGCFVVVIKEIGGNKDNGMYLVFDISDSGDLSCVKYYVSYWYKFVFFVYYS